MNELKFVKLMSEIANYDNINNPLLKFNCDLNVCKIIYPFGAKVSNHCFEVLQKNYKYSSGTPDVPLTYYVGVDEIKRICITVEFKQK